MMKIVFVLLLIIVVYYAFTEYNKNNSEILKTESKFNSGIEIDSLKRIETYGKSGTNWGMSPFGSGKPLTEEEIPKIVFKKPNTEWKTRTISGVTYVFGEGNPNDVALSNDNLKSILKKCDISNGGQLPPSDEYKEYYAYPCNEEDGYVTSDVEKFIKAAIEDDNWRQLIEQCSDNLQSVFHIDENTTSPYIANISYNKIVYENYLDLDNFLYIDTNGRKRLDVFRTYAVRDYLNYHTKQYYNEKQNPNFKNGLDCVDKYSNTILKNIQNALNANIIQTESISQGA